MARRLASKPLSPPSGSVYRVQQPTSLTAVPTDAELDRLVEKELEKRRNEWEREQELKEELGSGELLARHVCKLPSKKISRKLDTGTVWRCKCRKTYQLDRRTSYNIAQYGWRRLRWSTGAKIWWFLLASTISLAAILIAAEPGATPILGIPVAGLLFWAIEIKDMGEGKLWGKNPQGVLEWFE